MIVIVNDTEGAWRMADVIWVDGGARKPKVPTLFQVAYVDTGVINWINADLVTHVVPRVLSRWRNCHSDCDSCLFGRTLTRLHRRETARCRGGLRSTRLQAEVSRGGIHVERE